MENNVASPPAPGAGDIDPLTASTTTTLRNRKRGGSKGMKSAVASAVSSAVSTATKTSAGPSVVTFSHRYGHDPLHYPAKALAYALARPSLWKVVLRVACVGVSLAVLILIVLLAIALKPQAELISPTLQWWAWLIAVLLVLLEAAICVALLTVVMQSKAQTKLFVATMRLEGLWREGEMVEQATVKDLNLIKKAFFVRILTYPLKIFPFVGGAIYSAINATFTGWDYMDRYFDAIKLSSRLQRVEVFGMDRSDCTALCHPSTYDANNEYARFGFACSFLESVPIVGSVVFPLTNAVAAALFACDIERSEGPACLREKDESVKSKSQKS
ncbi:hypothetical protein ACHAWF_000852 [Thalassiosira exigua]